MCFQDFTLLLTIPKLSMFSEVLILALEAELVLVAVLCMDVCKNSKIRTCICWWAEQLSVYILCSSLIFLCTRISRQGSLLCMSVSSVGLLKETACHVFFGLHSSNIYSVTNNVWREYNYMSHQVVAWLVGIGWYQKVCGANCFILWQIVLKFLPQIINTWCSGVCVFDIFCVWYISWLTQLHVHGHIMHGFQVFNCLHC